MSKYARQVINQMSAYVPGEQPRPTEKVVKLNTNENPYPPAPAVRRLLRRFPLDLLRRYPSPTADAFRTAASRVFRIDPDMILTGNGSDELLNLIVRTFVDPGEAIAYPSPTYTLYPVLAAMQGAKTAAVPFGPDFSLPKDLAKTPARVYFLANPNAPTGTFIAPKDVAAFARRVRGLVVVDEAYADFAADNCLELAKTLPNVIVLRTLSKSYSLAGLRFGFAVASPALVADLLKVKDSYNCDAVSIAVATEAIRDQAYLHRTVSRIRAQRERLTRTLRRLGFAVADSHANFLWATMDRGSAKAIYEGLKRSGILVRYFDQPGLRNGLRITVGRPAENQMLADRIKELLRQGVS